MDRPYADDAWARVSSALSAYAEDWAGMHRDACEATHVHGEQWTVVRPSDAEHSSAFEEVK